MDKPQYNLAYLYSLLIQFTGKFYNPLTRLWTVSALELIRKLRRYRFWGRLAAAKPLPTSHKIGILSNFRIDT